MSVYSKRTWKSSPYRYESPMTAKKVIPREFSVMEGRQVYGECVAIHAPARMGKTLTAVKICIQRLMDNPAIELLVSNVPLDLSSIGMQHKFRYFNDVDILREVPPKGQVRIVFIDEMRRLTDSRMSAGQKNRLISNLFADAYKQRTDLIYTDQDAFAVDKRVRLNVNYVSYPMFDERTQWCMLYWFKSLSAMDEFVNWGIGTPFYQYGFWAPTFYEFFDTEFHVKDFHMKFHPERFVEDFLEWRQKKGYEDRKVNLAMIRYWDKTEAVGFDPSERDVFLAHLKLEQKV